MVASGHEQPFRYFNSSPEIIRLAVLMCVKYPLSLRNVEDLLQVVSIWQRERRHGSAHPYERNSRYSVEPDKTITTV